MRPHFLAKISKNARVVSLCSSHHARQAGHAAGSGIRDVESFRNPEGQPRQRVIVSLGDSKLPEAEMPSIAREA